MPALFRNFGFAGTWRFTSLSSLPALPHAQSVAGLPLSAVPVTLSQFFVCLADMLTFFETFKTVSVQTSLRAWPKKGERVQHRTGIPSKPPPAAAAAKITKARAK